MQAKIIFPGKDESVQLYLTSDDHTHTRLLNDKNDKFTWKTQPEAENILIEGVMHNDYPSQILKTMFDAGINPLPNMTQINNKIATLRKKNGLNNDITTTRELEEVLKQYTEVPGVDEPNKPFVENYKIEVLSCGTKARFWFNISTHNLMQRIKNNPLKTFQIDGTYKLIWIPEKQKEGWCVQVYGTSNLINEFFPTGNAITSEETAVTYKELFQTLETTFNYIMADGSKAITKGKRDAWESTENINIDGVEIDTERGMCWPHVLREVKGKLKGVKTHNVYK